MKKLDLHTLVVLALCCDLGLFGKKLLNPAANVITGALHIPGGVSTAFSLMFLTISAAVLGCFGCACLMGAVQSVLALSFGMVGSMGVLSPIGYILPGVVIDCFLWLTRSTALSLEDRVTTANALAAVTASVAANCIVFRLRGPILLLYLCVSATSGAVFGLAGAQVAVRLKKAMPVRQTGKEQYQ